MYAFLWELLRQTNCSSEFAETISEFDEKRGSLVQGGVTVILLKIRYVNI